MVLPYINMNAPWVYMCSQSLKITEMQMQHYQPRYKLRNSRDTLFSLWLKKQHIQTQIHMEKKIHKDIHQGVTLVVIPECKSKVVVFSFA